MYDVLEKIFAIILAVMLMFFFPLLDAFERMDDLSYLSVYSATVKFVDSVRNTGKITPDMYFEFKQVLDATGNTYSIEILHRKVDFWPAVDDIIPGAGFNPNRDNFGYLELYDEFYTYQILMMMNIITIKDGEPVYSDDPESYKEYTNFNVGDYFYVSVRNQSTTAATIIKKVLYGSNVSDLTILVPYGGMVRNTTIAN